MEGDGIIGLINTGGGGYREPVVVTVVVEYFKKKQVLLAGSISPWDQEQSPPKLEQRPSRAR